MESRKWIEKILEILHINLSDKAVENLLQFIKFGIVGLSNTVISYLLNVIVLVLTSSFNVAWDFVVGNMVAFLLSVLWSFYWNNRFVFTLKEGEHRSFGKALLKAYAAYGFTGIFLNNILSWIWITLLHVSKYIAPIINLIISVPLNFVINKIWTFQE